MRRYCVQLNSFTRRAWLAACGQILYAPAVEYDCLRHKILPKGAGFGFEPGHRRLGWIGPNPFNGVGVKRDPHLGFLPAQTGR